MSGRFNPTKEVPDYKLCLELKKLGYPQGGNGWYWFEDIDSVFLVFFFNGWAIPYYGKNWSKPSSMVKAPTLSEVENYIPQFIHDLGFLHVELDIDGFYHCYYDKLVLEEFYITEKTLINAFTKMLIWLVKNGYVSFGK